ncbi:hypothetical protein HZA99_02000 [Candidatus Woesearchaeota archaeon]|nr:hypothetical protein [Candidatus Woesearchaeota archaeon]
MTKYSRAEDFLIGTSFAAALVALIYSFVLFSVAAVDWGIFLFVIGFLFLFFLGFALLVPKD